MTFLDHVKGNNIYHIEKIKPNSKRKVWTQVGFKSVHDQNDFLLILQLCFCSLDRINRAKPRFLWMTFQKLTNFEYNFRKYRRWLLVFYPQNFIHSQAKRMPTNQGRRVCSLGFKTANKPEVYIHTHIYVSTYNSCSHLLIFPNNYSSTLPFWISLL